jgi:hypothetical protein
MFFVVSACLIVQLDSTHAATWSVMVLLPQEHEESVGGHGEAAMAVNRHVWPHVGMVANSCKAACSCDAAEVDAFWATADPRQRDRRSPMYFMVDEDIVK